MSPIRPTEVEACYGRLPGRLYLGYPDEHETFVAGALEATLE